MSAFTYPAKFSTGSDGRVLVEFVDLPRGATDGKNLSEAMEEAIDALGSDLSIRLSQHEEIPTPSPAKRGQRLVLVPPRAAIKLSINQAMREQSVTQVQLGERLGIDAKQVRRILDLDHESKLSQLEAALAALGLMASVAITAVA